MKILVVSDSFTDILRQNLQKSDNNILIEIVSNTIQESTVFPEYDVLVLVQTSGLTSSGKLALISLMNARKKSVIVGNYYNSVSGSGSSATHGLGLLRFSDTITESNGLITTYTSKMHSAMPESYFKENTTTNMYSTATYATHCSSFLGNFYTVYSHVTNSSGGNLFVQFPKNQATTSQGTTYPFDVYFLGCLSNNALMTDAFIIFTAQLLTEASTYIVGYVSGSVLSANQKPISRNIAIYEQSNRTLIAVDKSKDDGSFFTYLSTISKVFVVCEPDTEIENAQIFYNIDPIKIDL